MNAIIERTQRFLDRTLGLAPRVFLVVAAALTFPIYAGPLRDGLDSWVPFGLGVLALLFLRASVHGKVRDLVDVAVISVYFGFYLLWSSPLGLSLDLLGIVALFVGAALVVAWVQASSEDLAERQTAG
jgi:hypothetical protein